MDFAAPVAGMEVGNIPRRFGEPRGDLDPFAFPDQSLPDDLITGLATNIGDGQIKMFCLPNAALCREAIEVKRCGEWAPPLSDIVQEPSDYLFIAFLRRARGQAFERILEARWLASRVGRGNLSPRARRSTRAPKRTAAAPRPQSIPPNGSNSGDG